MNLLHDALDMEDAGTHGEYGAANLLYQAAGIAPWFWGISKAQLIEFGNIVRAAMNRGEIKGQPDPSKPFYYPKKKFDDPNVGPNMHQVCDSNAAFHTALYREASLLLPQHACRSLPQRRRSSCADGPFGPAAGRSTRP